MLRATGVPPIDVTRDAANRLAPLPGRWVRWPSLLAFKASYWLFIFAILLVLPDLDVGQLENAFQRWPREGGPTFWSHLATWDAPHFLFLLLMAFCLALQRERYDWAGVAGFYLPLTRAVGIFCLVPLLWHLVSRRRPWSDYLALIGPVAGYGAYFLIMALLTGNPLEGFEAQKNWGVNSFWHIFQPLGFLEALFTPVYVHWYSGSLLDRVVFLGLVALLPAIWRLDREWLLWTVMLGVMPAMISHFVSFTRYVQMAFPAFVAMAFLLREPKLRVWRWVALTGLASIHIVLLIRHINFRWAG
jgi:hypothetical protein